MKLTAQVKLLPSLEQAESLRATLETANKAASQISQLAWNAKKFRRFSVHRLCYASIRERFPLSAQLVVRLVAKVADAYKLDHKVQRSFRPHGSIAYDARILSWDIDSQAVSIWTLHGRQKIAFVCGEGHRELLDLPRGESDLVYRDGEWYLLVTVDRPTPQVAKVSDFIGVDLGLVAIAQTSDGTRFAGGHINGARARHRRLRRNLQAKGTRSAKRLLKKRRRKERHFAANINHIISKQIVSVAERTGRGIALENLNGIRARIRAQRKQRARLHSWAFSQLQSFVLYKAARVGVPVVFVDPHNTSRTCPKCGVIDKRNRPSQSEFRCVSCGHSDNADATASENIRRAAVNRPYV